MRGVPCILWREAPTPLYFLIVEITDRSSNYSIGFALQTSYGSTRQPVKTRSGLFDPFFGSMQNPRILVKAREAVLGGTSVTLATSRIVMHLPFVC